MNGYKIVLLKAILCFIGCRKVNGYSPEYVLWQMITLGLDKEGGSMSVAGNALANDTRVLYGAYQIVIAGICLPFGAFLFRNRKKR